MSTPSKRKGTSFETSLRGWLIGHGMRAVRNTTNGAFDIGDLAWVDSSGHHYVVEAKATKTLDLAGFWAEAEREADNYASLNKVPLEMVHPLVIVKRRNAPISKAYVVQSLEAYIHELQA